MRCREDFESLLQSRLDNLDLALSLLERLVAGVERCVEVLEKVRCRRGDAVVMSSTGALLPSVAMIQQSERIRLAAKAIERAELEPEVHSGRLEKLSQPAPPGAWLKQNPRRHGRESEYQVFHVPGERAEVPSPRVNPVAWPAHSLPSQAFHRRDQAAYAKGYASQHQPGRDFPFHPTLPIRSPLCLSWDMGFLEPGLKAVAALIPDFQRAIDYRGCRLQKMFTYDNTELLYRGWVSKVVQKVRSISPRLRNFDVSEPIALLSFLRVIRSAFDALKLIEGASCCLISLFLIEPAITVYLTFTLSGVVSAVCTTVTWARIVNTLTGRYLIDGVLGDAYARVTIAHHIDV